VFLIFGANGSGEFFGYAKMMEAIDMGRAARLSQSSQLNVDSTGSSLPAGRRHNSQPQLERLTKEDENRTGGGSEPMLPRLLLSPSPPRVVVSSPLEITPAVQSQEHSLQAPRGRYTDPSPPGLLEDSSSPLVHAQTLDPKALFNPYFPPVPIAATIAPEADFDRQLVLSGSDRLEKLGDDRALLCRDTALSSGKKKKRSEGKEEYVGSHGFGEPFRVRWIRVRSLPFTRTRHLHNPWNADREVKVSRDGTEVETSECAEVCTA
jgi:hypothetical protein